MPAYVEKAFKLDSHREAGGRPGRVKLFQSTPSVLMDKSNTDVQQFTVTAKN